MHREYAMVFFFCVYFFLGGGGGWLWSVTLKNRGRSKKTEGQTGPKSMGGSLAVGNYLQRGSPHPPPPRGIRPCPFTCSRWASRGVGTDH